MGPRRKQYDAFAAVSMYDPKCIKNANDLRKAILEEKIRRASKKPGKIVRRKRAYFTDGARHGGEV